MLGCADAAAAAAVSDTAGPAVRAGSGRREGGWGGKRWGGGKWALGSPELVMEADSSHIAPQPPPAEMALAA